jgi:hypothetical protein
MRHNLKDTWNRVFAETSAFTQNIFHTFFAHIMHCFNFQSRQMPHYACNLRTNVSHGMLQTHASKIVNNKISEGCDCCRSHMLCHVGGLWRASPTPCKMGNRHMGMCFGKSSLHLSTAYIFRKYNVLFNNHSIRQSNN